MALRVCLNCTTRFAVGLEACPHCQSTDHEEAGDMPKITRHGGATNAAGDQPAAPTEEVPSSPGNSSSASPEKPQTKPEQSEAAAQRPARTTGNRSTKGRKTGSTARSTATNRTADS